MIYQTFHSLEFQKEPDLKNVALFNACKLFSEMIQDSI